MQNSVENLYPENSVARNDTARKYPQYLCVHTLFERQVQLRGDSPAVAYQGQNVSYAELNRRSNQLARHLRGRGVGPEILVGLCVERSVEMVVALLGILKAGGAYVPLDPAYPSDRITYILEDASAPVLLTQERLLGKIPKQQAEVVLLDAHWPAIACEEASNLGQSAQPENLAYVIYTSGSTGKPKGVQLEHRSVVNFLCSMQVEPGLRSSDVMAAVTTLCFDIAGLEIYLPLVTGAQVVVVSTEDAGDGRKLQARMRESGVTVMQATPATWRMLLHADWSGDKGLKVLCGGEALPGELADKLLPRCGSLWNMYGPTETTIWSAVHRVTRSSEATIPIGHPIANTQLYLVNEDLKEVPPGEAGELLIGGDGLARGYVNRPDLTKEKFISDPFSTTPGARLYKTGDMARRLSDGTIGFLGRIDQQVKIRGYRIELGEIESVLSTDPSVRQCVVVATGDPSDRRLIAYVVPAGEQRPIGRRLRQFLSTVLPEYMMPAVFVILDGLPLTPNGKIDRKQLPAPSRENSAMELEFVPARDELEQQLVNVWESVLKISPIGISDNIFDLGVNSLLAAELFARMEKTVGRHLPPGPLFQAPTIESLAALLRKKGSRERHTSLVSIQPHGSKTPLFCVHGGAGTVLLFHSLARHLAPERPVYGLQARGLYGRKSPDTTVEAMAAHYIKEMRSVQPHGPYLVGGWCFGGIVAFEMGQQLQALGEKVETVVMFNAPSSRDHNALEANRLPDPIAPSPVSLNSWREIVELEGPERLKQLVLRVRRKIGYGKQRLRRYLIRTRRLLLFHFLIALRLPLPDETRNYYFLYRSRVADEQYQRKPYAGRVLIFRDQGPYPDANLGWGRFVTGTIECYEIPVRIDHHRALMQEPTVGSVADKLEAYLARTSHTSVEFCQTQTQDALAGARQC